MNTIIKLLQNSFLRYIGIGGLAFIVDFTFTIACHDLFHLRLWIAVAIGYWSGFLINFAGQRNFSFQSNQNYLVSLAGYFTLIFINWYLTTLLMSLFVQTWHWPTAVGKILVTAACTLWNYPVYRFVIFPAKRQPKSVPLPETSASAFNSVKSIDFIVPAHNSAPILPRSLETLARWAADLPDPIKVTVYLVENASTDDTLRVATDLAAEVKLPNLQVRVLTSQPGLGAAYRAGVAASSAELLVLTADDLPFNTSDIDYWRAHPTSGLTLGSKAHPDSQVPRSFLRNLASSGFAFLRQSILRSKINDSQGTLIGEGTLLRAAAPLLTETGYLSSTEIVYLFEHSQLPLREIPVTLDDKQNEHSTRIRISDVFSMAVGLFRIRRTHRNTVFPPQ